MANKPTDKVRCVPRRHIEAAAFKTYDAMMAVVMAAAKKLEAEGKWKSGEPLPTCFVSAMQLANMNNRNKSQEDEALRKLEREGWIVRTHEEQRRWRGRMSSNEYRVLTHEEFLAAHLDSCPQERYVIQDERHTRRVSAKTNRAPRPLERRNITKMISAILPDSWLDAVADAIWAKRTGAEIPAAVTVAGNPLSDTPRREIPSRTVTGNPVTTATGNPVTKPLMFSQKRQREIVSQPTNCRLRKTNNRTGGLAWPTFLLFLLLLKTTSGRSL